MLNDKYFPRDPFAGGNNYIGPAATRLENTVNIWITDNLVSGIQMVDLQWFGFWAIVQEPNQNAQITLKLEHSVVQKYVGILKLNIQPQTHFY